MKMIPPAIANKFGRQILQMQKHSPRAMLVGGIATGVASTVLACRATLKLSDSLAPIEELKNRSEDLHDEFQAEFGRGYDEDYDNKKYAKDQTVLKLKAIMTISKLYAPAAGLAMISACLLTGSHVTLNRRNASLTAAYAATDKAFQQYRDRVTATLGKEKDDEFRYGTRETQETVTEDGKKKVLKHNKVGEDLGHSQYARFFDELLPNWKANPELNRLFLQCQQSYANDLLVARGHVFLNEVYDMLGIERTGAGAVVGWLHGKGTGDDYVDFGIFDDKKNPVVRDFVNGRNDSILLDFNVDGTIYDKI